MSIKHLIIFILIVFFTSGIIAAIMKKRPIAILYGPFGFLVDASNGEAIRKSSKRLVV